MSKIPKERIHKPTRDQTYIAFAEAVDAWSKVEWQMVFLFHSVNTPGDLNKSGSILISIIGVQAQLRAIEAAARVHLRNRPELLKDVERTTEKIGKKATLRNRIIHGRWGETHNVRDGTYTHTELTRRFSSENFLGPVFKTDKERTEAAGRFVFDKKELEKAAEMFIHLARTIEELQIRIVNEFLPRLG